MKLNKIKGLYSIEDTLIVIKAKSLKIKMRIVTPREIKEKITT